MYSNIPSFVLGFHGCDRETARSIISDPKCSLHASDNLYDWLGSGIYFWENSPARALEWAKKAQKAKISKGVIEEPCVIGAVIDLGHCLNLTDTKHTLFLKETYAFVKSSYENINEPCPKNTIYKRELDCEVINATDYITKAKGLPRYDSVRSPFMEGDEVYPDAGFLEYTHLQICIRNPNCIKGYFHVRNPDEQFDIP